MTYIQLKQRLTQSFVFLLFAFCFSCKDQNRCRTIIATEFPINEKLTGKRVDLEYAEYIANIVEPAGSFLVFNAIRSNYSFQVYDKDFHLVDTIVGNHDGPNELPGGGMYLGQWNGPTNSPTIKAYSSDKRLMAALPVMDYQSFNQIVSLADVKGLSPSSLYQLNDSLFCGVNLDMVQGALPFIYNSNSQELKTGNAPFEFNEGLSLFYATQQSLAMSGDGSQMCTAYLNMPWMVIYDASLTPVYKIAVKDEVDTSTLKNNEQNSGLINVKYHKGHISVIYVPKDGSEHLLTIFDMNGKPEACYGVGDAIWYVTDEANDRLLTIHYDEEEDVIYLIVYPLPKVLK